MATVLDFELDPNTLEPVFRNGDLALLSDGDVVAQRLRLRLRTFVNTWFLDKTAGTRYYEVLFEKNSSRAEVEAELRSVIGGCPNVRRIVSLSMDYDGARRALTVNFEVETDFGPVSSSVTV